MKGKAVGMMDITEFSEGEIFVRGVLIAISRRKTKEDKHSDFILATLASMG